MIQQGLTEHFAGVRENKVVPVPYTEFLNKTKPISKDFARLFDLTKA
jgi:hypothetical protein